MPITIYTGESSPGVLDGSWWGGIVAALICIALILIAYHFLYQRVRRYRRSTLGTVLDVSQCHTRVASGSDYIRLSKSCIAKVRFTAADGKAYEGLVEIKDAFLTQKGLPISIMYNPDLPNHFIAQNPVSAWILTIMALGIPSLFLLLIVISLFKN